MMPIPPTPAQFGRYTAWRPGQVEAIRAILGATMPHLGLQMPTGSGKSLVAAAAASALHTRTVILTATRGLQDQYRQGFRRLVDMRGMGNYECLALHDELRRYRMGGTMTCEDGPCRSGVRCSLKESGCLYFDQQRLVARSPAVTTSYAYFLASRRYGRGMGGIDRLILDEAHALPDQLTSAFQIRIPRGWVESLAPRSPKAWRAWASARLARLGPPQTNEGGSPETPQERRMRERCEDLAAIDERWAWDGTSDAYVFEPVSAKALLPILTSQIPSVVYMSATLTPEVLCLAGVPRRELAWESFASTFPAAARPVYVLDTARIDHRTSEISYAYWLSRIDAIISQRLDRKGIIHPVSYRRQQMIVEGSRHRGIMIAPSSAGELGPAINHFKLARPPRVLVTPSVATGYDFPYETCEYQILAKVPFPDTRSRIMRARIEDDADYRPYVTMQAIVQAYGRDKRAEDDQGEFFIVDNHFQWFYRQARLWAPQYFQEAVQFVTRLPDVMPALAAAQCNKETRRVSCCRK